MFDTAGLPDAPWQTLDIGNRAQNVRDVTPGEDASRIHTRPGMMARTHSVTLNVLRAKSVQNIRPAVYANAVSLNHLLAPLLNQN